MSGSFPEQFGWCRTLHCIDALLNALTCIGPLWLYCSTDQMKKDYTPDQECKPQHQDESKEPHGTHSDEVQRLTTSWTKNSRTQQFKKSPSQIQNQFKTPQEQVPRPCNYTTTTCYDPHLQGFFIWQCHLSRPLDSYIIGSSSYLSSRELPKCSSYLQQHARQSQKQSSGNCRQVELHNHDNCKTVASESNEFELHNHDNCKTVASESNESTCVHCMQVASTS